MVDKVDTIIAPDKWVFDKEVTDSFENMLSRSIPQYEVMREYCFKIACQFQKKNTDILDIGCSNGLSLERIVDKFGAYNKYFGVDVSEPMLDSARERFKHWNNVFIKNLDLRVDFPSVKACIISSIFTIQFIPIEYRLQIMRRIYEHLIDGGVFIFCEKILCEDFVLNQLFESNYLALKKDNRYTEEQILRKKASLEGVLVPLTDEWNKDLLKQAGFKYVSNFWRFLNFTGYVCIK